MGLPEGLRREGFEIVIDFLQAVPTVYLGFPTQYFLGPADIGLALQGVVLGQGLEDNLLVGARELDDLLGEFQDGGLVGVSDVDGFHIRTLQESVYALDLIVDIGEGTCLGTVPEDRQVLPS